MDTILRDLDIYLPYQLRHHFYPLNIRGCLVHMCQTPYMAKGVGMPNIGHVVRTNPPVSLGQLIGTVKFLGVTEFATGEWLGIELDEQARFLHKRIGVCWSLSVLKPTGATWVYISRLQQNHHMSTCLIKEVFWFELIESNHEKFRFCRRQ